MPTNNRPTPTASARWRLAQWLEVRWWRRYLGRRPLGDYLAAKQDYWQRLLSTLDLALPPGGRLLDAGCGPAGLFLLPLPCPTDAVDPLLDQYRANFPHLEPAAFPNVHFHGCALEDWAPAYTYEFICCCNAINHVNDWPRALDRLTALAAPGGRLLLGVDVHRRPWAKALFRRLPGDVLHPHQHDAGDYRRALRERGWQIERTHTWRRGWLFDFWLVVAHHNPGAGSAVG